MLSGRSGRRRKVMLTRGVIGGARVKLGTGRTRGGQQIWNKSDVEVGCVKVGAG